LCDDSVFHPVHAPQYQGPVCDARQPAGQSKRRPIRLPQMHPRLMLPREQPTEFVEPEMVTQIPCGPPTPNRPTPLITPPATTLAPPRPCPRRPASSHPPKK